MTEVPEHLLKKAAEARARRSGEAPPADSAAEAAPAAAAPVPAAAAAPTPAVPEEPKAPEPVAPYVEAAQRRKTLPVWIIPVLLFLPIWAIYYVGLLENPPAEAAGLAFEGDTIYGGQCAGCHGGGGGGGAGRQLNGGEVLLTFPSLEAGASYDGLAGMLHWVTNGTAGSDALGYGDPARPGGQHVPGSFGQMSGFGGLGAEGVAAAVYHERSEFGDLEADAIEAEQLLIEELLVVMTEAGVDTFEGASIDTIQGWIDTARSQLEG